MNTRVLFLQAQVAPGFASSTATQKLVLTVRWCVVKNCLFRPLLSQVE